MSAATARKSRGRVVHRPACVTSENEGARRKTAPAGNRGLTSAGTSRQEALVTIAPRPYDRNPQAREPLFDVAPTISAPPDRHYFTEDAAARGYCAACNLPRRNRRHAERAA